mgnify:CR=1 FL=1|jgi:hypothetical protein|tara:strand:+ start:113 stop:280 length:168 start_codon:yes stop_codon:yes gene_type:complete
MNKEDRKYMYGIFKRFKKKYPKLTFKEFEKEIMRDDFDEERFHRRLQIGRFEEWT